MLTKEKAGDRTDPTGTSRTASSATGGAFPFLACAAIALAALLAYWGTLSCPFILDDMPAIKSNGTIGHLWGSLVAPVRSPVSGRPLLNFSYAVNFAVGGYDVRGYHLFNLVVHILGGLMVFGIVGRTLGKPVLSRCFAADRRILALLIAVIWTVHPLNTEAVTYVSERAESLMGLLYLATLYLFLRGAESGRGGAWLALSVFACRMGALTKEVIATAPLLVLLYDRTFCAGSFKSALRQRWLYYLGLSSSWLVLAFLVQGTGQRGVGFGNGVGSWTYALTSCRSVVTYLKLSLWPHPLVFDYGTGVVSGIGQAAPYALALFAMLAFSVFAMRRWAAVGFACAWFLVILAPTSSVIPLAYQPMAEHRAYLPLVSVACVGVLCVYRLLGRSGMLLLAGISVLLGWATYERNCDYRSALALWNTTAAQEPANARAHVNLGVALAAVPGSEREAASEYEVALLLDPANAEANNDFGLLLAGSFGRYADAEAHFRLAVRSRPDFLEACDNLGMALAELPGRLPEAIQQYEAALRLNPGYAKAHNDLGIALARTPGRLPEALAHFEKALQLKPDYLDARNNLETARQMMAR